MCDSGLCDLYDHKKAHANGIGEQELPLIVKGLIVMKQIMINYLSKHIEIPSNNPHIFSPQASVKYTSCDLPSVIKFIKTKHMKT